MNLNFIKTEICPKCGCNVIVEESIETYNYNIKVHTNGGRWEHRKFLCGTEVCYVPNFRKEEIRGTCIRDPIYLQEVKEKNEKKKKVIEFMHSINYSNDEIECAISRL